MNKKTFFYALCLALGCASSYGQLHTGGLPLSANVDNKDDIPPTKMTTAVLPDWDKQVREWDADPSSFSKPYLVSLFTPTDLSFEKSGVLTYTEQGMRIWKAQLYIPDAKAIGLYYDQFFLPAGVRLFISNENGKQLLGAYTQSNNDLSSGMFANEPVQGSIVNLEMNIDKDVDVAKIKLHINRSAVYFRGIEYLQKFTTIFETIDQFDAQLAGSSSVCNINAVCPLGNGYEAQRDAALHTICVMSIGTGTCSSTMINTAANTPGNCKQYLLIASHCEFSNAITDNPFSQFIFRFNYQHNICNPPAGTITNTQQTITGAKFVSRSNVPLITSGPQTGYPDANAINGDFILLEFEGQNKIPDSWNVNLAGWNSSATPTSSYTKPKKFIGFHHPAGDVKKVSAAQAIQSYAIGAPNSHWLISLDSGYAAQGSSGSALFDGDGRIIGVASVAAPMQDVPTACLQTAKNTSDNSTAKIVLYSKLANLWDYSVDGNLVNRKLKPWLDPSNSNVVTVNTVKSNCSALNSGPTNINHQNSLAASVSVYPNPAIDGKVNLKINLAEISNLDVTIYDFSGKLISKQSLNGVRNGIFPINLSNQANGVYSIKISDGQNTIDKKVVLAQ